MLFCIMHIINYTYVPVLSVLCMSDVKKQFNTYMMQKLKSDAVLGIEFI